jgi:hypothetical protein
MGRYLNHLCNNFKEFGGLNMAHLRTVAFPLFELVFGNLLKEGAPHEPGKIGSG